MGITIDEIRYEELLLKEWENEKKEVFKALGKIANSRNTDELVKNLKGLKGVYISGESVGSKNLDKAIGGINFEMIEFKKSLNKKFRKTSIMAVISIIIGIIGVVVSIL